MKKILFSLIAVFIFSGCDTTITNETKKKCEITPQNAPDLRGFRLETPFTELKARFPEFPSMAPDEFGLTEIFIEPESSMRRGRIPQPVKGSYVIFADMAQNHSELQDVSRITLRYVDGVLAVIEIRYINTEWNSITQYAEHIDKTFKLNSEWKVPDENFASSDKRSCMCKGLDIKVAKDMELWNGGHEAYYSITLTDIDKFVDVSMRVLNKKSDDEKRRKDAEDAKRKSFKP